MSSMDESPPRVATSKTMKVNTLLISTPMVVSTPSVVTATTKLKFERGGLLQKSGAATITFQGPGLVDPKAQRPAFSGFAVGEITWIGIDYPRELSLELWDTITLRFQIGWNGPPLLIRMAARP